MWRDELGIEPAITIREAKVHLSALRTGTYDIAFVTTLLDVLDPLSLFEGFAPDAANNFPHWRDPAFERTLTLASTETNLERQAGALRSAEERLLEDAAIAPLYFNVRNYLRAPRVRGWQEDPLWTRFYLNLTVDEK
jgi:ABC-type oligopeptide transport system substrate-binding subunit